MRSLTPATATWRLMGSMSVSGRIVGPFRYQGVLNDDPNDLVPHESRRDLRGSRGILRLAQPHGCKRRITASIQ